MQAPNNHSHLTLISSSVHHGDLLLEMYEWSIDPDDDVPTEAIAGQFLPPYKVKEPRDWLTYWLEQQEVQPC